MNRHRKFLIGKVARILDILLDDPAKAAILDGLLGCDADDRLSDFEAEIGDELFGQLSYLCPQAVELAATGAKTAG